MTHLIGEVRLAAGLGLVMFMAYSAIAVWIDHLFGNLDDYL